MPHAKRERRGSRLIEQLEPRALLSAKLVNTLSDYPTKPTIIGNDVYYMLRATPTINEALDLYRSDGTAAGTRRIRPIDGQTWVLNPHFPPVEAGGRVFMQGSSSTEGQLWDINGRTGRADPLLPQGARIWFHDHLIDFKGLLYFPATDGQGSEVWRSDGTRAGTARFTDLMTEPLGSQPHSLVSTRDHLYFSAVTTGNTSEAWRTDGTHEGTQRIDLPVPTDLDFLFYQPMVSTSDQVYLRVTTGPSEEYSKLWASDGTTAGSTQLEGQYHYPTYAIASGSRVFFTARTDPWFQIWMSEGTSAGTQQVTRLQHNAFLSSLDEHWMPWKQEELIFSTASRMGGPSRDDDKLWKIDSALQVTRIFDGVVDDLTQLRGKLFFTHNGDLYVSDGTPGGTMAMGVKATEVASDGNRLFFTHEKQLWTLDPTRGFASGAVWHDVNGNGRRDGGEEPLAGFRIFADINRDKKLSSGEPFVRTDAEGRWNLQQLPPGKYPLRLTSVGGWSATTPGTKTVAIRGLEGGQFSVGLRGAPGSIAGTIYDDDNGNGRTDGTDLGLSGFRVFVDLDRDGRLDSGEPWMRTDSRGRYRFDNLPPTTYSIRVTPVEAWRPRPDWQRSVTLSPGALLGANFYLAPSITIRGQVFWDDNHNGQLDEHDDPVPLSVYIDLDRDAELDFGSEPLYQLPDAGFRFTGLGRGTYHIRILEQDGIEFLLPSAGYFVVEALTPRTYDGFTFLFDFDFG